jgi:hypothetical protein
MTRRYHKIISETAHLVLTTVLGTTGIFTVVNNNNKNRQRRRLNRAVLCMQGRDAGGGGRDVAGGQDRGGGAGGEPAAGPRRPRPRPRGGGVVPGGVRRDHLLPAAESVPSVPVRGGHLRAGAPHGQRLPHGAVPGPRRGPAAPQGRPLGGRQAPPGRAHRQHRRSVSGNSAPTDTFNFNTPSILLHRCRALGIFYVLKF